MALPSCIRPKTSPSQSNQGQRTPQPRPFDLQPRSFDLQHPSSIFMAHLWPTYHCFMCICMWPNPIHAKCWGWPPSNTCPPEIVTLLFECLLTIYLSLFINISTYTLLVDFFRKSELITLKLEHHNNDKDLFFQE